MSKMLASVPDDPDPGSARLPPSGGDPVRDQSRRDRRVQDRSAGASHSRFWNRVFVPLMFSILLGAGLSLGISGCASPEDGRPRGGGAGADGGNYRQKPIHAPSKLDGTKPVQGASSRVGEPS